MKKNIFIKKHLMVLSCFAIFTSFVYSEDWTTWRGDISRSGVSTETISFPLKATWAYKTRQAPNNAINTPYLPAKSGGLGKAMTQTFTDDNAYQTIVAENKLYFSSSTEESVYCLDAKTGEEKWHFFCEGPVRFAPVYSKGKIYFGSDDGSVYSVDAQTGEEVWRFYTGKTSRRVILNNHISSQWPVRTGLTIKDDVIYVASGIFPSKDRGVALFALNANDGSVNYKNNLFIHAQGHLLINDEKLIIPAGRASPLFFNLSDGKRAGAQYVTRRDEGGGSPIIVGDMLVYGPNESGFLKIRVNKDAPKRKRAPVAGYTLGGTVTGLQGSSMVSYNEHTYVLRRDGVYALPTDSFTEALLESTRYFYDKKFASKAQKSGQPFLKRHHQGEDVRTLVDKIKSIAVWQTKNDKKAVSMVASSNAIFVGGENFVQAFNIKDGSELFSMPVEGKVWDLAISNDAIYASTDKGNIYCFSNADTNLSIESSKEEILVSDKTKEYAKRAIEEADTKKGYAVVLGAGDGSLAYEIAKNSEFTIICLEHDANKAKQIREKLLKTGLYGKRIAVHHVKDEELNYLDYFANLIVAGVTSVDFKANNVKDILQPNGGTIVLPENLADVLNFEWEEKKEGFVVYSRGKLEGEGEWTHMFANSSNTIATEDKIVTGNDFDIQWIGSGGSERQFGWHYNSMTVLSKDGKMILTKADHIEAHDQYNGTYLWGIDVPESLRLDVGNESGQACVDSDYVYVAAKNDCWLLDINTGEKARTYFTTDKTKDWGYVAIEGGVLLGSTQNPKATMNIQSMAKKKKKTKIKSELAKRVTWGSKGTAQVVSDSLFALDKKSGELKWEYKDYGYILNPSITIGDDNIYFMECRNKSVSSGKELGFLYIKNFFEADAYLVALDVKTGQKKWEKEFTTEGTEVFYMSYVKKQLLVVSSSNGDYTVKSLSENVKTKKPNYYQLQLLSAENGNAKWEKTITGGKSTYKHNVAVQPAVIMGEKIYLSMRTGGRLFIFDLKTGKHKERPKFRGSKGCSVMTGSATNLFFRNMASETYNSVTDKCSWTSDISRPSCWLNNIGVGGLILLPEASTGCDCTFAMQVSIVLAPKKK